MNKVLPQHPDTVALCSMAKLFATDSCFDIVNTALQVDIYLFTEGGGGPSFKDIVFYNWGFLGKFETIDEKFKIDLWYDQLIEWSFLDDWFIYWLVA